ncbi:MAG: hypothetical protein KME43_21290 [Myxacorys chilensis ATA2-1-KO14]|jgi:SOS-response transcriptional repressor LexA|nr:hypothetical protein [Myxacorys chilensis ATA2-1-KO14]
MITINKRQFEITGSTVDLTKTQQDMLEFLSKIDRPVTMGEAVAHFNLSSPAPILGRINHLIEKGAIKEMVTAN